MYVKVEVQLTTESMTEFMLHHVYSSGAGKLTRVLGFLNIVFVVTYLAKGQIVNTIMFAVFAVLLFVVFPKFIVMNVKKQMAGSSRLKEPIIYEFDDKGVYASTKEMRGWLLWKDFKKAIALRHTLVLYDDSKQPLILPIEELGENYRIIVQLIRKNMRSSAVKIR